MRLFEALHAGGAEPGVVVNSAGMTLPGYFTEATTDQLERRLRHANKWLVSA